MAHHPQHGPDSAGHTPPRPPSPDSGALSARYVLSLAASLLAAPLLSGFLLRDVHDALSDELEVAVTVICIAALVLPAIYTGVLVLLARRPDALARGFLTHPSNSQRAQALGVDMDAVLRAVLQEIGYPAETERCTHLEQEITFLELQLGARGEGEERGGPRRAAISK